MIVLLVVSVMPLPAGGSTVPLALLVGTCDAPHLVVMAAAVNAYTRRG